MDKLIPAEFKNQRIITTKQLAEVYQTTEGNISNNFNNNIEHFENEKHYFLLQGEELREFKRNSYDIGIAPNVNKLYLWTERGANRHCKILDTDKAWEQFDNLEETYFRTKENVQALNTSELSPELQMFKQIFDTVAKQQLENKQMKAEIKETKEEIKGIRDVVAINTNTISWREDCRRIIVKIANKLGGNSFIGDVNREIYELMRIRLKVRLDVKLTNLRRRMADEGVCKSKREKTNYLDVIKDDSRLVEGYVSIVKELAVKYGADIKEVI